MNDARTERKNDKSPILRIISTDVGAGLPCRKDAEDQLKKLRTEHSDAN